MLACTSEFTEVEQPLLCFEWGFFLKKEEGKKKMKKKKDEFRAAFSSQGGSVDVLGVCGGFACFIGHRASGIVCGVEA